MEENKTNYGKIIAVTLAVISAASAIAYVIYRLCRSFFAFCDSYYEDELEDVDFDEIDENADDDLSAIDEAESENAAADTAEQDTPAESTEA